MRTFASLTFALLVVALPAHAADPPTGGPAFMASAPAATVSVEDAEGGARIVLCATDAREVEALRAWARQLAEHLRQGCPMKGAGMGPGAGAGPGKGMQMHGQACPRLSAPSSTPAAAKP